MKLELIEGRWYFVAKYATCQKLEIVAIHHLHQTRGFQNTTRTTTGLANTEPHIFAEKIISSDSNTAMVSSNDEPACCAGN